MIVTYLGFSIRIWVNSINPDNDVHTSAGAYADVGELFMNTTSGEFFICTQSGSGSQIWKSTTNAAAVQAIINSNARSQSSVTRSLNTAFQISATRDSNVTYSVDIACTSTLVGGQSGTVYLEICANSSFSSGVQEIGRFINNNSVSIAIAITVNQTNTANVSGFVPAGYYCRLRTANNTGTPTFTYQSGQEVLL